MQDKPDAIELIETIQEYLLKEVMPAVKDNELLSYKTLVSWNMLGVVSRELNNGEMFLDKELDRLKTYLQYTGEIPTTYEAKLELCKKLSHNLSKKIRQDRVSIEDAKVWNLVKDGLKEKLMITNPRFSRE